MEDQNKRTYSKYNVMRDWSYFGNLCTYFGFCISIFRVYYNVW